MARIIAEAGVRLVADRKGLASSIRNEFRSAIKEATAGGSLFDEVDKDSDRTAKRAASRWTGALNGIKSALGGLVSGFAGIGRLLLMGTVAAGAVAGIVSLTTSVLALGQALVTASGVAGLLPAALAGLAAIKGTLALGLSGVSEGFKAIGEDAAKFNESIKDLAPSAQGFLRALREQKGAFDDLKLAIQERLFRGLGDAVAPLAERYLPVADRLFVTMAGSMNNAARQLADFALEGEVVGQVTNVVDNLRAAFNGLVPAVVPATSALLDITDVGSRFLPEMTEHVSRLASRFGEFVREAAADGRLEAFFQRAIDTLQQLGRIVGDVFGSLGNIMSAAQSEGAGLLNTIERITQSIRDWTGSVAGQDALKSFFESMQRVVSALGPPFFDLVTIIGRDFIPILADIASIIGPVLAPLFGVFAQLLQALRPLIAALAGAFSTALAALEPFFDALADSVVSAMPELLPVIEDIGEAFADLFEAMVPLAPLFVDLVAAVLPIVPPLIQMIAEIMPELIDLVRGLLPLIQAWVDMMVQILPVFTAVLNFLLNVFVPVITAIAAVFSGLLTAVTLAVTGIWDVVTTVFGAIGDFFVSLWDGITSLVSGAWNAIGGFFSDGIASAVGKIGQFAADVWNGFKQMMSNVLGSVGEGIANVVGFFIDLPGKILGAIGDLAGRLFQLGKDMILGLINGIKSMVKKVIDTVTGLVGDAINAAKALLGIASPSKVFEDIGRDTGLGMIKGLTDITPAVADAASAMARLPSDVLVDPFGINAPIAGDAARVPTGPVVHQTNIMQQGVDIKQFADLVLKRGLGDYLSSASTLTVDRRPVQAGVAHQWVGVG